MNHRAKILLVDDDSVILKATRLTLESAGYEISTAATGAEGLRLAETQPPDLALLDRVLPDLDGIEVCRRLKTNPITAQVFVALFSAMKISGDDRADGLESGADDYIARPISNRELLARVQALLRIKQAEDALRAGEEQLRSQALILQGVLESADALIFSVDKNYGYTSFNGAHAAMMKAIYGADIQIGHNMLAYMAVEADRAAAQLNLDRALRGEQFTEESFSGDEKLTRLYFEVTHSPIKNADGDVIGVAVFAKNITERKRVEAALRESEARYKSLLETQTAVIARSDTSGRLNFVNDAYCQTFGQSREALLGELFLPTIIPEDQPVALAVLQDIQSPPYRKESETRHFTPGGIRWFLWDNTAVVDESGQITEFQGTGRDITARKLAEEDVAVRVRQQATIAGLGQLALLDLDLPSFLDQAVRRVAQTLDVELCKVLELLPNRSAVLLRAGVGWADGLVGRAIVDIGLESQAGFTLQSQEPVIVADLRTEQRFHGPPLLHEHHVISGMSIIIGTPEQPYGVLGAHTTRRRDFTPHDIYFLQAAANLLADAIVRKQVEESLIASEVRYRRLFEAARDGILILDAETGIIVDVNPFLSELLGFSPETFLKKKVWELDFFKDIIASQANFLELQQKKYVRYEDLPLETADGRRIEVEFISNVYQANHRAVIQCNIRDITARKQAEAKINAAQVELQRLLATADQSRRALLSMVEDREQTAAQLRAALAEKEVLLREVHHRVKNNLQAIIALAEMRREQVSEASTRQMLKEFQEQARTMSLVYEQLYQSDNLAQVDMPVYLENLAFNVLAAFGENRDIDLRLEVEPVSLDVSTAMPGGLIVNELLTNALKHAFPPDFSAPKRITVGLKTAGETTVFWVSDNGVGLPAGQDWRQAKSLGLQLVDLWATHQLGGRLEVDTRAGVTFKVTLRERP